MHGQDLGELQHRPVWPGEHSSADEYKENVHASGHDYEGIMRRYGGSGAIRITVIPSSTSSSPQTSSDGGKSGSTSTTITPLFTLPLSPDPSAHDTQKAAADAKLYETNMLQVSKLHQSPRDQQVSDILTVSLFPKIWVKNQRQLHDCVSVAINSAHSKSMIKQSLVKKLNLLSENRASRTESIDRLTEKQFKPRGKVAISWSFGPGEMSLPGMDDVEHLVITDYPIEGYSEFDVILGGDFLLGLIPNATCCTPKAYNFVQSLRKSPDKGMRTVKALGGLEHQEVKMVKKREKLEKGKLRQLLRQWKRVDRGEEEEENGHPASSLRS